MNLYQLIRPLIFKLEPETAHNLAIKYLQYFPHFATQFFGCPTCSSRLKVIGLLSQPLQSRVSRFQVSLPGT